MLLTLRKSPHDYRQNTLKKAILTALVDCGPTEF